MTSFLKFILLGALMAPLTAFANDAYTEAMVERVKQTVIKDKIEKSIQRKLQNIPLEKTSFKDLLIKDLYEFIPKMHEIKTPVPNAFENILKTTHYKTSKSFTSLFNCILDLLNHDIPNDFEAPSQNLLDLKEYMEAHDFNPLFNMNKLLNLISQNIVNNELILFLTGYFNVNIVVYSYETKIINAYYLEEKINVNKKTIFVALNDKINPPHYGYQGVLIDIEEDNILTFMHPIIKLAVETLYVIPIGLIENKNLYFTNAPIDNDIEFNLGIKKEEPSIDEQLFIKCDKNILEDDIDIKSVKNIKNFNKNKLLKIIENFQ